MKIEPATVLVVEVGSFVFFFLLLPLIVVVSKLRAVWQADRGTGLLLSALIVLTGIFFVLFFVGLVALTFFSL